MGISTIKVGLVYECLKSGRRKLTGYNMAYIGPTGGIYLASYGLREIVKDTPGKTRVRELTKEDIVNHIKRTIQSEKNVFWDGVIKDDPPDCS